MTGNGEYDGEYDGNTRNGDAVRDIFPRRVRLLRLPGAVILRGARGAYPGRAHAPRIARCDTAEDIAAMMSFAGVTRETAVAQMYVDDPATDSRGRKSTLHFYVAVTDARREAAPSPEVTFDAYASEGFLLRTCHAPYTPVSMSTHGCRRVHGGSSPAGVAPEDAAASHFADRSVDGDVLRGAARDVRDRAAAERWAASIAWEGAERSADQGADCGRARWDAIRRAARLEMARVLRAAAARKSGPVGEMDLVAHWRRVRLPKVLEFVFVVDRRGVPWLVDLDPRPSFPGDGDDGDGDDGDGDDGDGDDGDGAGDVLRRVFVESLALAADVDLRRDDERDADPAATPLALDGDTNAVVSF